MEENDQTPDALIMAQPVQYLADYEPDEYYDSGGNGSGHHPQASGGNGSSGQKGFPMKERGKKGLMTRFIPGRNGPNGRSLLHT